MLGFGIVPTYKKIARGKYQLLVIASKWKDFKVKLKYLSREKKPAISESRLLDW